jgi:serine/threonine protein kinase/Tol biopolymer transport system component
VKELAPGILLGHYKIVRRLGQGGMGVVYEAADQKLGRHVAIKLLTEATRDSSAALERFWREARAASSLNHPGICTIYELNESAETPFIVMELLEGSSLEKLYRGHPMPYAKLLEMGAQLADALDAAHRKGILHRDIKPANIFLTNSGQAKLLDFGLAKVEDGSADGSDPDAPTAVNPLTSSGSSVGTVAYMSPEQARAEPLDARSDLFSLGVVLYEMATGQHPFTGASTAVVFDRILNHAPVAPVSLNSQLPVEFEEMLNKTLEKDRELRCQAAAELRGDLKRLQRKSSSGSAAGPPSSSGSSPSQIPPGGATQPGQSGAGASSSGAQPVSSSGVAAPAKKGRRLAIGLAAVVILAAIGLAVWRFWPRPRPFAEISVNQVTHVGTIERLALSGDGRFLAEVKNDNGQRTLWVRNTVTNTDTQILGAFTNRYVGLTFSPDGNYLYFARGTPQDDSLRALYMMPVFGGMPRQLALDIDSAVSFAPDGNRFIYVSYTADFSSNLHLADKDGSNNQVIYATKKYVGAPVWSPDGGQVAWIGQDASDSAYGLQLLDLSSKKRRSLDIPKGLVTMTANLAWLPDGDHLFVLYRNEKQEIEQIGIFGVRSRRFYKVTNDPNSYAGLAVSADGRTLATAVTTLDSSIAWYKPESGAPITATPLRTFANNIAWANEDRLLLGAPGRSIRTIDHTTGNMQNIELGGTSYWGDLSACGDGHILFAGRPKGAKGLEIFRMDPDGSNLLQLTNAGYTSTPICSPDSTQVYYSLHDIENKTSSLWVVPITGGKPRDMLLPRSALDYQISRDGRLASFEVNSPGEPHGKVTEEVVELASRRLVSSLPLQSNASASFSPDGRALVYPVFRNGSWTLLYQPLDGSATHALIDPIPGHIFDFAWSSSGKQLAVLMGKSSSDVVLITDQEADQAGKGKD